MGNINIGRWIVGGVVTAIILFVTDRVLNGVILDQQFDDAMTALGMPAMSENFEVGTLAFFAVGDLIVGLTAVGIYVGIRPRFGGATTAVYAGLATWLLAYGAASVSLMAINLLPAGLLWTVIIVGVIQVPVATVACAYLYRESPQTTGVFCGSGMAAGMARPGQQPGSRSYARSVLSSGAAKYFS